jgi:hypothetical protein
MKTAVGSTVHPWYKGTHEWRVRGIAQLKQPIEYPDPEQGNVRYDPKIMLLEAESIGKVLWFPYWMATDKTKGRMKWGQRPPVLEERVFLKLMKDAIKKGLFSERFLQDLYRELQPVLK